MIRNYHRQISGLLVNFLMPKCPPEHGELVFLEYCLFHWFVSHKIIDYFTLKKWDAVQSIYLKTSKLLGFANVISITVVTQSLNCLGSNDWAMFRGTQKFFCMTLDANDEGLQIVCLHNLWRFTSPASPGKPGFLTALNEKREEKEDPDL